jgi:PhnB protein
MSSTVTAEKPTAVRNQVSGTVRISQVQPYLFFGGRCEEAIEFYRRVLGAEVTMLMRFKDSPDTSEGCGGGSPVDGNNVMHASLRIGDATLLASDGCQEHSSFQGFSLSLTIPNAAEAERIFASLSESGQVQQPMIKTFFAERFGIVADKFGVSWMVVVVAQS